MRYFYLTFYFLFLTLQLFLHCEASSDPAVEAGALSLPLVISARKFRRNEDLLRDIPPFLVTATVGYTESTTKATTFISTIVKKISPQKPTKSAFKFLAARYSASLKNPTMKSPIQDSPPEDTKKPTDEVKALPTTSVYTSTVDYESRTRCQTKDTLDFYSSAMTCTNNRSDRVCSFLFHDPDPVTGQRDPKCNVKGMEDIADSCRRQCAICCEHIDYACEDDHNGIIDCTKQLDKCNVGKWFDVLSKFCAGSCGLCTKTECRDFDITCREEKHLCLEPNRIDEMRKKCARTCGFCVVGGDEEEVDNVLRKPAVPQCVDKANNCTENERLCASPAHAEFMINYCAKTCFKCTVQGPNNIVVPLIGAPHDVNGTAAVLVPASVIMGAAKHNSGRCEDLHPKCSVWVSKGFCIHKKYTVEQRRALCPKSCKLC